MQIMHVHHTYCIHIRIYHYMHVHTFYELLYISYIMADDYVLA